MLLILNLNKNNLTKSQEENDFLKSLGNTHLGFKVPEADTLRFDAHEYKYKLYIIYIYVKLYELELPKWCSSRAKRRWSKCSTNSRSDLG